RTFAPLEERKEAILARLMAVPEYLASARTNLGAVPAEVVARASRLSAVGIAYVEEAALRLVRQFPPQAERIEHAGSLARRGLAGYQEFLRQELLPRAGGSVAIGERWFSVKLEREHLLPMDAAALEAWAREQLAKSRALLVAEAARLDPARPWAEQLAEAAHRGPEPLHVHDAYAAECHRAEEFLGHKRLAPPPACRLEFADTPAFLRPTYPVAGYEAPAPFDTDPVGVIHITPLDPADQERSGG